MTSQSYLRAKEILAELEELTNEYKTLESATNFFSRSIQLNSVWGSQIRTSWLRFDLFKPRALAEMKESIRMLEEEFKAL